MTPEWFVAWVATGSEEELLQKIAAMPKVETALCPKARLWVRRGGQWTQEEQLLFPGYLFIRCRMDSAIYYALRETPGVLGWLGRDTLWPSTVRPEEMDRVIALSGGDPQTVLEDISINRRQRRGYGTLNLKGAVYRIPFNAYNNKQAEAAPGDASPTGAGADQTI